MTVRHPSLFATHFASLCMLCLLCRCSPPPESRAQEKPPLSNGEPRTPAEEQKTFRVQKDFRIELVACEPNVIDPVALAFDEQGRLFVAEMHGYPNAGVATGIIATGRIRLLEDRDGDGFYETSTVYADKLRLPTSVMPYKGGLLVANAPDLIYLEDTDGDGKADKQRVLYTGFDLANIQQLLNHLQWGLDNWVYACAGGKGGDITSPEKKDMPPLSLRGRGIRFKPDVPGSIEPTSGGGQYGLTADRFGRWFTNTNSQHLRHIVLPDHYLQRNPNLAVPATTLDIAEHGAACKVFRLSPFEAWRVERTTRRKDGPDSKRFPTTELVPGGFVTSACSPLVYEGGLFPREYQGNVFLCDPANNLILRDLLEPKGATFVAKRADPEQEFLASTDNWFRPTALTLAPDGTLYIADFYREAIETPLSLPEDIKLRLNLQSRQRGRIWRIVPAAAKTGALPKLSNLPSRELVMLLDSPHLSQRLMAQRLLIERRAADAVPQLRALLTQAQRQRAHVHALWTLETLRQLHDDDLYPVLQAQEPGLIEHALRIAEGRLVFASAKLKAAVLACARSEQPRTRFQAAFTLGALAPASAASGLAEILSRDAADPWIQTAVLSSSARMTLELLQAHVQTEQVRMGDPASLQGLTKLAAVVAARAKPAELALALQLVVAEKQTAAWQLALLEGLAQGVQNTPGGWHALWTRGTPEIQQILAKVQPSFTHAATRSRSPQEPLEARLAATRLLSYAPFALAGPAIAELLEPQQPPELQLAGVRALGQHTDAGVSKVLLGSWPGFSPALRREATTVLLAETTRVQALLTALEQKQLTPNQLEPARLEFLRKHPNAAIRAHAVKLLANVIAPARLKVVEDYQPALDLKGDLVRGKVVFKKTCASCHRLENEGHEVGPDLRAVVPGKTLDALLLSVLDPNREVDPRFLEYSVMTTSGKVYNGMLVAETANSITLRRAEKQEDTLLRSQIESITASVRSLMPEGLEQQITRQDMADVLHYLRAATTIK